MIGSNNVVSTKRKTTTNGKKTYPATYTLEGVQCYIERASAEIAVMYGDIPAFKKYLMICEKVEDIVVGDLVIDSEGNEYTVYADQAFKNNVDVPNHTEVLMQLEYHED